MQFTCKENSCNSCGEKICSVSEKAKIKAKIEKQPKEGKVVFSWHFGYTQAKILSIKVKTLLQLHFFLMTANAIIYSIFMNRSKYCLVRRFWSYSGSWLDHFSGITYSCEHKQVLLFRKSEILLFKVSITNMPHIFFLEQKFFVFQDRKLKF